MRLISTLVTLFFTITVFGQIQIYPKEVEIVLKKSGKNRTELEKVITYFQKTGDSLKIKAVYFIIENMDIHYSQNYYWADSLNHVIPFNELNYSNFEISLNEFEKLKTKYKKIHPVPIRYADIDSIKADFLIDNVNRAFSAMESSWVKSLSFNDFCNYVLPYRVSSEPLQFWRKAYQERFAQITDSIKNKTSLYTLTTLNNNLKTWFLNTWGEEERKEPLPMLGPLQLLFRKQGLCQDAACLGVYTMRSQGIPCCMELVPFWATTANRHFWDVAFDENLHLLPFEAGNRNPAEFNLEREPGKVLRVTYAKQMSSLASQFSEEEIPDGIMKRMNIADVTASYWPTKDVHCELFQAIPERNVAYACVLNSGSWRPSWWGKIENKTTTFSQMSRGVVYLPMLYTYGKLIAAGYPVALGYEHEQVLKPDTVNRQTILLAEEVKYLIYRPEKHYRLFYWDNRWKLAGEKIAQTGHHELSFEKVPRHALFILLPEYTNKKERPFTITDEGKRIWW